MLVVASMLAALIVGIPAGIALSRPAMVGRAERFMQVFNVGNTVPPLAVLAIALGFLGIGSGPAIFALFLASLLPIVRNTYEGLKNVQGSLKEAAVGIGMTQNGRASCRERVCQYVYLSVGAVLLKKTRQQ